MAKTIKYGTGKGRLDITGMAEFGLLPGDTLLINPGCYKSMTINNLRGISITCIDHNVLVKSAPKIGENNRGVSLSVFRIQPKKGEPAFAFAKV